MTSEIGDDAIQAWVEAVREQQRRVDKQRVADRNELAEALHHACQTAKRCPYVIGTSDYPSRWDNAHIHVNYLLDELVGR